MNKMLVSLLTSLFIGSANATAIEEHITNGGFETGDFYGWGIVNTGNGAWNINDGTFVPNNFGPLIPISGNFDAVTTQLGPGFHDLSQDILLPSFIGTAILSWDDRIRTSAFDFSDSNQEWRVLIEDLSGGLIAEVFSTNPGDSTLQTGPNHRAFDLTTLLQSFAGQSVRISFEEQDNLNFFSATLDNVSFITISEVPEPITISLLGLGLVVIAFSHKRK